MRLTALVLMVMAIAVPLSAAAREPTPAECTALLDVRDQLAPGTRLSAIGPMAGGNEAHRQTRLSAVVRVVPSDVLPQLERAIARASEVEFVLTCPEDRARGGAPRQGARMSLPVFSEDGRWMMVSWLVLNPPVGSEGYECVFEWTGGWWVGRSCELTYVS